MANFRVIFRKCLPLSFSQSYKFSTSLASRKIFTVQDEKDFQDNVVKSNIPVIVDFKASWCGPCKILEPRLENIVGNFHDKVHLAKVDIDANTDLAMEYNVEAVPFVVGFKDGKPMKSFMGVLDNDQIESFVKDLIG